MVVNTDYNIVVTLIDTANGSTGKPIALSVASPDSTITATVTTNGSSQASATFHTGTAAGYNNITAKYAGTSFNIPVIANPGPPYSLNLITTPSFRLANGISTATASASVYDRYHNAIGGITVNFTVDGTPGTAMTDPTGTASYAVGPYGSAHAAGVTASVNALSQAASVRFLDRNNLFLDRYPAASMPIESRAEVVATFYEDLGNHIPAAGVPLTFTAYGPDFTGLGTYSGVTDANGTIPFYFNMSGMVGNNTVQVSNADMGGNLKSTIIYGEGGDVSSILISSTPASPIYADGASRYSLEIRALDVGGNPVANEQLIVIKNSDYNYTYLANPTNTYGYTTITTSASKFVCTDNYTVLAVRPDPANNSTSYVSSSIFLTFRAGDPAAISVVADPNAVANANVSTPAGSPDVHTTDITALVTDQWGHPLQGQTVTITSLNKTLGNITGPAAGQTLDSGEFTTQFTLSPGNYGTDTVTGAPIQAVSGSLSAVTNVLYTQDSFLSIKSSINPKSNLSVNNTINVNVTVRGIGWKIRGQSYDIALIFDSSGSMDWLSTMTYPQNVTPIKDQDIDTMGPITGTMADDGKSHTVMTFHNSKVQDIEVMVSSSYRNYANGSYYDTLKVTGPGGASYTGSNSANENYRIITNAPVGDYTVTAQFNYASAGGTPPYNAMVVVDPKRLGQSSDLDSAAKVAATQFVNNMTDNQVSVIWFNDSYRHNTTCYWGVVDHYWDWTKWKYVDVYGWIPSGYVTEDSNVSIDLKTVNSNNKTNIIGAIDGLNANGGTHIGAGIATAIDELTGPYSNKSNQKVAILLSDGYSQSPTDDINQAYAAKAAGVKIYTIGMGMPDTDTLNKIANITGTDQMRLAISSSDLEHTYGEIAGELKKVVANNTDMHVITGSQVINGTLYPDAVYVPGSAQVRYPNGTVVQQEPIINNSSAYVLQWNPGTIKLNDTWTVNYQLKVMKNGTIEPIMNTSYIDYVREDGSNGTSAFSTETLYVGGSSNDDLDANTTDLAVTITDPLNASHGSAQYNITTLSQLVKWNVNYTGNYSYTQTVLVDSDLIEANYVGNGTAADLKKGLHYDGYKVAMTPGPHVVEVIATEYINGLPSSSARDSILLYVITNNGQITLE